MATEKTLVLIKPDSVQRGLAGRIISRFEEKGFQLCGVKLIHMDSSRAARLYEPHLGKPFYDPLVKYMTSGPIVALCLSGHNAIEQVRTLMGATNPSQAAPGSIRGDFAQRVDYNCVHGSDSAESAQRELPIFFEPGEIVDYEANYTKWV
ncbi:MAG: nucleoside-diphosphate kinase [Armatimonadetes bacterium]|nr:nucleoside-diphosphate kinase [Armatimonadota bacterium]